MNEATAGVVVNAALPHVEFEDLEEATLDLGEERKRDGSFIRHDPGWLSPALSWRHLASPELRDIVLAFPPRPTIPVRRAVHRKDHRAA
jgi:hypothetical protein